jgi:hypothetical protein
MRLGEGSSGVSEMRAPFMGLRTAMPGRHTGGLLNTSAAHGRPADRAPVSKRSQEPFQEPFHRDFKTDAESIKPLSTGTSMAGEECGENTGSHHLRPVLRSI